MIPPHAESVHLSVEPLAAGRDDAAIRLSQPLTALSVLLEIGVDSALIETTARQQQFGAAS